MGLGKQKIIQGLVRYVSDKEKILQMVYQNLTCRDDITSEDLEEAIQSLKTAKFEAEIKEKREKIKKENGESVFIIEDGWLLKYKGSSLHVTLPDGVKAIASNAFKERNTIESITLPSSVVEIDEHAFANLKKLWVLTFRL